VTERRQLRAGSFSVMVPAPRDQGELEATLARLTIGDDPPSEVLLAVADGDDRARAVAEDAAARHPTLVTVVDEAAAFEPEPAASFSVMVPAPHERGELEATLARLLIGDDPPSEVLLVVADGDAQARAVAEQVAASHPGLVTVIDEAAAFEPEIHATHLRARALRRGGALLAAAAGLAAVVASIQAGWFVYLLYVSSSLALAAIAWTTLVWMLYAWRTPTSLAGSRLARADVATTHSFSLIVPARHEQEVLEGTLSRLARIDHPDFEVLVVVGSDDDQTRAAAERVAARHPERVSVVVDGGWPKSKPRALNAALPHCSGDITGVFDAEDDVHPAILERVDQCFQNTAADVVQAGVQLMNFRSSWLTVRNVLEYYFWFRSRLHFHASQGFIPLGGNTVFVRTQLLRAVSGWDPDCLAEDCELGVRLSALGARTVVFYEPELVTREECPPTLKAFARQRTRWNQGYLQTLARGHWRRLGLRQRALGAYVLAMPYLMAIVWLTIPVAVITALTLKMPVPIALISFLPAVPMVSMLAVEVVGLGEFCRTYGERASARDYLRLVLGVFAYQSVLAFAAARAVVREVRGDRGWEKTEHLGLHLAEPTDVEVELAAVASAARARAPARALETAGATVALLEREHEPPWEGLAGNGNGNANGNGHWNGNGNGNGHLPELRIDEPPEAKPTWLRSHADLLLLATVLAAVGFVQATNTLHWPEAQFDEGTYVSNAWAVSHGALAPYTYSYGHPPLAWLLIAAWTWASGLFGGTSYSIDTGRQLMLVVTMVSCSLLFILARRLGIGRWFAAAAVILFALSPVGLFFHRAVLLDNVATAWVLAAFVLAVTPRKRLWAYAGSGACFAAALLSKETTLVLLPALLLAAWQNTDKHTRRYCMTLLGSFAVVIALSYPLYATLKGELLPGSGHVSLLGYAAVQLVTREATGSFFDPHSQTHAIVTAWLQLDPWLLGLALALSPLALARRSTRAIALAFVIQVAMILRPGYLPNMYVIGLLPFAALIVVGAIETLWRRSWVLRLATAAVASALVVSAAPNWARTDNAAMSVRVDGTRRAAERWLAASIGHDKRLIVPDEYWIYLIEHGFDRQPVPGGFFSRRVVVYWPLDYDPAVKQRFADGWRDFDYVVSTQAVRSTLRLTPTTAKALDHSVVVAQFGQGDQRIEVRAIRRGRGAG
jgi:cellulose synthase/poly-beta-1,6-N-acetylglucosamine synthase-like glycosyltransferase